MPTCMMKFTDAKAQPKIVSANFSVRMRLSSFTGGAGSTSSSPKSKITSGKKVAMSGQESRRPAIKPEANVADVCLG